MISHRPAAPDAKRAAILAAALKLLSQYGYRRTSIDDIAREAEIAKGTVYLSFKSKEEIFRALCESLIGQVAAAVERARGVAGPIEARLAAVLEAKFARYFETVHRSAHAAELIDSKNQLSADLFESADRHYRNVLRATIDEAVRNGELAPARVGLDASDVVQLLIAAAHGVESAAATPAAYRRRLRDIVRVMAAGLSAPGPAAAAKA